VASLRTTPKSSDSDLIRAFLRGDATAATLIVDRHWDAAYRIAYLALGDRGSAEEVAQDALLDALGAAERFDSSRPLVPWIRKIAANRTIDRLRQRRSRPELVSHELDVEADASAELAAEVATHLDRDALHDALLALPADFRLAVVLRYLLDYEPIEIAEMLGIPASTIRTRIHRGLERLRDSLGPTEGEGLNERTG
jgi:RNA polymerase sigma-70 factor, ECF subfamily